ncbi:MAG: hypothetical protein JW850_02600 [Thermoflexales bacterium]|nr:hypothetical protein [Thermoflexales bacterium]
MAEVLRIVGTIAGIGGISLGIVLIIYRDFVRDFIQSRVFKTLSSGQATLLMGAVVVFTFSIAIIGIFTGFVKDSGSVSFILLVVVLLVFILSVLYLTTKRINNEPSQPAEAGIFFRVHNLVEHSDFEKAEKELTMAANAQRNSADFWYWRSKIAFAKENSPVASAYVEEALKRDPRHIHSLVLKIKLLLLSGKKGDWAKAKDLAEKSYGLSDSMDVWLASLKAENMLSPGPKTNHELDTKCPPPAYVWNH